MKWGYSMALCNKNKFEVLREGSKLGWSGKRGRTPDLQRMPLGSLVTSQPSLQPGTIHLFDIDPSVITGVIDPNTPIGTKGLLPKTRWPYTSSAITRIPSILAVSATCKIPSWNIIFHYKLIIKPCS